MKKRDLKTLKLNKMPISNFNTSIVKGGRAAGTHYESICDCPDTLYTISNQN